MMKIYTISHLHDISDDQEQWKILGYFSSRKKAKEAFLKYKQLPGFKDHPPEIGNPDVGGRPSWEGGFCSDLDILKKLAEKAGESWPPENLIKYKEYNEEIEDLVLEIPYWAKDAQLNPSEDSEAFAHRLMQAQGIKEYPTAPESEFFQLKIWAKNMGAKTSLSKKEIQHNDVSKRLHSSTNKTTKSTSLQNDTMNQFIYDVSHLNPKNDDVKGIRDYFTLEEAQKVVEVYKTYKGFKDSPEGFFIQRYRIDEPHWNSGYATVIIPRGKQKNDADNQ